VLVDHPDQRILGLDDNRRVVADLKPSLLNDIRLQMAHDRLVAGTLVRAKDVVAHMSNAAIVQTVDSDAPRSPCWDEVLAEEKQGPATRHLTADELPQVGHWPTGQFPAQQTRELAYHDIATTLPPEFVTKPGYRLLHSLAPAAFESAHAGYSHLLVVQRLARLDPLHLQEQLELSRTQDAKPFSTAAAPSISPVDWAVGAICAMVVLVGTGDPDATSLTASMCMTSSNALATIPQGAAHRWIRDNWTVVRTLPSRNYQLSAAAPGQAATDERKACLQSVFREHTGLNWRSSKRMPEFELSPGSLWSKLGIDVARYTAWYSSPCADAFGLVPTTVRSCGECDGIGENIRCVRQKNMWRCLSRQTADSWPHRQQFDPLDVCAAWVLHDEPAEQKQIGVLGALGSAAGRLLGHLGFPSGAKVGGPGVSPEAMQAAWEQAVITEEDRAGLLVSHGVDLGSIRSLPSSKMATVRKRVNVVFAQEGLRVIRTRPGRGHTKRTMYCITANIT
jgi:hypothetical protein